MVESKEGLQSVGTSQGFPIPDKYIDEIKETELGKVMDKIFSGKELGKGKGGISFLTKDELLEWGLKLFYFGGRKCVQAVNFASKLTLFLFDIKSEEIGDIANGIAMYLNEIYSQDLKTKSILERFFAEYPICTFSRLVNKSIIASLNHNQFQYADDGYRFYEYIDKNILNTIKILTGIT